MKTISRGIKSENGRFYVVTRIRGRQRHIGVCQSVEAAQRLYDEAAFHLYGWRDSGNSRHTYGHTVSETPSLAIVRLQQALLSEAGEAEYKVRNKTRAQAGTSKPWLDWARAETGITDSEKSLENLPPEAFHNLEVTKIKNFDGKTI